MSHWSLQYSWASCWADAWTERCCIRCYRCPRAPTPRLWPGPKLNRTVDWQPGLCWKKNCEAKTYELYQTGSNKSQLLSWTCGSETGTVCAFLPPAGRRESLHADCLPCGEAEQTQNQAKHQKRHRDNTKESKACDLCIRCCCGSRIYALVKVCFMFELDAEMKISKGPKCVL